MSDQLPVCSTCGVAAGQARTGKMVHIAAIPEEYEAHDVTGLEDPDAFRSRAEAVFDLRKAAQDMLAHHATLHPETGCEWADRLHAAVRAR